MLGHRFEQGALHLGGCPVDLIGEQQVVKQRTGLEDKAAILGPIDVGPRQIGGEQIRRELDAVESNMQRISEDIPWLVEKFDYRNKDADWKSSRDAIQRGMQKLKGGYPADPAYKMSK